MAFRLIVCVHDLAEIPVATGDEKLCWVPASQFRPWLARLDAAAAASGLEIELTSDDAFESDYSQLLPLLAETGRTATFFIPTAFLGRPGRLTIRQLRELHAAGMRIGTHGVDHLAWSRLPPAAMQADIVRSIATLEDLLGAPVTRAAPPFGAYDRATIGVLEANGIEEIHTCDGGIASTLGPLRTRLALSSNPAVNAEIIALAGRRPGARELLRTGWHHVRMIPPGRSYRPRRAAALSSAA